jgi:hypothetical protein
MGWKFLGYRLLDKILLVVVWQRANKSFYHLSPSDKRISRIHLISN